MLNKYNFEIAPFADAEKGHYSLNGIYVSPAETVATNGHLLVKVSAGNVPSEQFPQRDGFQASDEFTPFILPTSAVKDVLKLLPKKTTIPVAQCVGIDAAKTNANGRACLLVAGPEFQPLNLPKESGTFPNYQAVFPKEAPEFSLRVNADYLKRLAQTAASFTDSRDHSVTIRYYGEDKAIPAGLGAGRRAAMDRSAHAAAR